MTPAELVQTLSLEIKKAVMDLKLRTEYEQVPSEEDFVAVNVFAQSIPKNLFEETSYLPFVTVELLSVEDDKEGSIAQIGLSFATFGLEEDGWLDLFHLMEVTRQRLLTKRLIGNRFRLQSAHWEPIPSDNQPAPFQYGAATLSYQIFQPQERI
ncbi:MAG: hypothetical protein IKZ53_03470 [Selenomonadaceae bacterium]|nr:hypothetical protein [Selenomonadaceae bacterium]